MLIVCSLIILFTCVLSATGYGTYIQNSSMSSPQNTAKYQSSLYYYQQTNNSDLEQSKLLRQLKMQALKVSIDLLSTIEILF